MSSSYQKTVERWRKENTLTFEEMQRIAKEKATTKVYKEKGEHYLDPKQYKEIFKNWPEHSFSKGITCDDYETAVKKRIDEFSEDKKGFYNKIIESRHK